MKLYSYIKRAGLICATFMAVATNAQSLDQTTTLEQQIQKALVEQIAQSIQEQIEVNSVRTDLGVCRNTQILSFNPKAGSAHENLSDIEFIVTADTHVQSLEAQVNGEDYPVEYREREDGTYQARVRLNDEEEGHWYVVLGAGSFSEGACNDTLQTSFERIYADSASTPLTAQPSKGVPHQSQNNSINESNTPLDTSNPTPIGATGDGKVTDTDEGDLMATGNLNEEDTTSSAGLLEGISSQASATVQVATSLWDTSGNLIQTAAALGGVTSLLNPSESCATFGSQWPWYMWLFVLWIYLVVVWLALVYFAEPYVGSHSYSTRLGAILGATTVLMVLAWYVTNPCLTHIWMPFVTVLLGVLLYWLYSEEQEEPHLSGENN